jgi:hypothetical protein
MRACYHLFVFTVFFLTTQAVSVVATNYQWSAPFGDGADQIATSVAMDRLGDIIVTGDFTGTVDFGGGPLVCVGTASSMYIAKISRFGGHVWSRSLGDSMSYGTNRLAIDDSSTVLVASDFRGTVDFGDGPITGQGFRDGVVGKFDIDGNHVWSRSFGGNATTVNVKAAAVDGLGRLVVAGTVSGQEIDFGGATLAVTPYTTNMFVVMFDADGDHLWSRKWTGDFIEITAAAVQPNGGSVFVGYHNGTFDFGGGGLTADAMNIFVAKYDVDGNHKWSNTYGASGTIQRAFDVALDATGHVFLTGEFIDAVVHGGCFRVGPCASRRALLRNGRFWWRPHLW